MTARILYVDDEDDIREVAVFSLELDPDLEVRVAASGAEALEILKDWAPNLVLLDVMMPRMDGPATLVQIRTMTDYDDLPVVFITARTQAHEVQKFIEMGAAGVIAKPFDPMSLATTARSFIA